MIGEDGEDRESPRLGKHQVLGGDMANETLEEVLLMSAKLSEQLTREIVDLKKRVDALERSQQVVNDSPSERAEELKWLKIQIMGEKIMGERHGK